MRRKIQASLARGSRQIAPISLALCVQVGSGQSPDQSVVEKPAKSTMRGDPCGQWQQDYQYPTGEIALREHYTRGILLKSEWFKPDGTHIQTTNWTNLSGESISLRSDGSVRVRASILHGLPDGEVVFFDESGAVERRQRYRNGAPLDSLWFDAAGTAHGTGSVDDLYPTPAQRRREHYVDGKLVRVEIFSPWNTLMMIVEHRDGGTEATYLNLDGTLQSWVRISIDRADSDKVAFDSEGKITQHSGTRCGIPFGP